MKYLMMFLKALGISVISVVALMGAILMGAILIHTFEFWGYIAALVLVFTVAIFLAMAVGDKRHD